MGDLHRPGRFDRLSDDVLTLTGRLPLSVQEFVRRNAGAFTASARAALAFRPLEEHPRSEKLCHKL
jgi:hypothetical protein